jgi:hypothetical protein
LDVWNKWEKWLRKNLNVEKEMVPVLYEEEPADTAGARREARDQMLLRNTVKGRGEGALAHSLSTSVDSGTWDGRKALAPSSREADGMTRGESEM